MDLFNDEYDDYSLLIKSPLIIDHNYLFKPISNSQLMATYEVYYIGPNKLYTADDFYLDIMDNSFIDFSIAQVLNCAIVDKCGYVTIDDKTKEAKMIVSFTHISSSTFFNSIVGGRGSTIIHEAFTPVPRLNVSEYVNLTEYYPLDDGEADLAKMIWGSVSEFTILPGGEKISSNVGTAIYNEILHLETIIRSRVTNNGVTDISFKKSYYVDYNDSVVTIYTKFVPYKMCGVAFSKATANEISFSDTDGHSPDEISSIIYTFISECFMNNGTISIPNKIIRDREYINEKGIRESVFKIENSTIVLSEYDNVVYHDDNISIYKSSRRDLPKYIAIANFKWYYETVSDNIYVKAPCPDIIFTLAPKLKHKCKTISIMRVSTPLIYFAIS